MRISTVVFVPFALLFMVASGLASEERAENLLFEPSSEYPYGRPNPEAPEKLAQFAFMIGQNDCTDERLNNASGEWDRSTRTWDAHYFMNGYAIRDTGRSGGSTNGNIRVFDSSAQEWLVTFFSMPTYGSGVWRGGMEEGNMVLKLPQKAPGTDIDGFSRLTFSNISNSGFNWDGEWVSEDGSVVFPFWKIRCSKR